MTLSDEARRYQTTGEIADDATAKALREQNYKKYFNQQLQLDAAQKKANLYFQQGLEQQGLGSTGGSDISRTMMNNAYMNQAQANLGSFQDTESTITADNASRWQTEQASKDQNFLSQLNSIGEMADISSTEKQQLIDKLIANYGYNDSSSEVIKSAIDTARAQLTPSNMPKGGDSSWYNNDTAVTDTQALKSSMGNWGQALSDTLKYIEKVGPEANGMVFQLQSSGYDNAYLYYDNGRYYRITEAQADNLVKNGAKARKEGYWGTAHNYGH